MGGGKRIFRIKEGCPLHPFDCVFQGKDLPFDWLDEVTESEAMKLKSNEIVTYGFSRNEVEAFFRRHQQELNVVPS